MSDSTATEIVRRLNRAVRSKSARLRLASRVPFGERLQVCRYILGNGLKVMLLVDHSAPVVSYHTWFRVGSRNDRPGKTGLAHLFEHLMFNETKNLPAGVFDRTLEAAGGESNAATWVDWTYYYANIPASELALIVSLEADRMANLVLRSAQVESEKQVVANERRYRVEDDVEGTVSELLYATAFKRHPYGQPTVGWMADIEGFSVKDCRNFYRTYYSPNNATLILAGDFDQQTALGLIQEHYGRQKAARIPRYRPAVEAGQRSERRLAIRRSTPSQRLLLGFRAPAFSDSDYPALVVANEILFGGRSSRLYRRLIRDNELAVDARGSVAPFCEPGLLEIWVVLRQGKTAPQALRVVDRELERLCAESVGKRELEKVINRLDLAFLQGLESASGKAERIGFYETVMGDARSLFARRQAFSAMRPEEVQRVARRYFRKKNRTVITVEPGDGELA
ncbi:MAG: insulinase family protein [Deltaproteobacteria bacterium]|nr:insulinase family protein [Deltaproteobacteria bacterium]